MTNSRGKLRKLLMIALYQHLTVGVDIFSYLKDNQVELDDEFVAVVTAELCSDQPGLTARIADSLTDWSFDRLGRIEQAILLLGAAEMHCAINDRAVTIDEAVKLAKTYCDPDAYKLINATLDKL